MPKIRQKERIMDYNDLMYCTHPSPKSRRQNLIDRLEDLCKDAREIPGVEDAWLDLDCFNCGEPGIGIEIGLTDEFMESIEDAGED